MLYVVGLGSGSIENMTKEAFDTLESCSLIVGYGVYVDNKDHFPHKEYYTTPMKQEIDRCKYAIEQAESGKEVAVISVEMPEFMEWQVLFMSLVKMQM